MNRMVISRTVSKRVERLQTHPPAVQPIATRSFLQRSLLFARLASIAYEDFEEACRASRDLGFPDVALYDRDGAQAFRFRNDSDCVIACRGTEPHEWNDIRADANGLSAVAETVGRVHRGFKREVDDLWPMLEAGLVSNDLPLWFCGHSLGGAMATICAGRCYLSHIDSVPRELFTFGSPRVGNKRYINYVKLRHYRFVNNNDIVTRVPPVWLGYRHTGCEQYIDSQGGIGEAGAGRTWRDRWRGFVCGLRRGTIDHFADHSMHAYVAALSHAVTVE